ncbi:tropomodulin isoform X1 [Zeugodacus cucurbitae]|uniref:tropomodulin isoform X1 n=1 Tax=Zeugodacus cucurbitae TaxID=28588 RepID=UPI0023D8F2F9|nr:tropomodulin isoform X1 [Zeugodacus cucurbitae]XP_054081917.1 tropomodulin isoform X1 [Zeugodacus cucurbitae]XP_054081918.1 tropomodulin isoform X1 [Zeugodacus cucurbitae]XP_054081919.1 tropomodulin isoform X1 [Zeugodacus cucurbitae]
MSEVESAVTPAATSVEAEQEPAEKTVTQTVDEDEDMKEEITAETEKMVTETVDEDGDVVEETTEIKRKTIKRTMKITETSSTTKTTTLTTPAKLYGKDLSEYDEVDVDALLAQLSPEEINILAKEVDPDDNFLPPDQRCSYECEKDPTGPLNRKKLIEHINKQALETPDEPEFEPYVKGTVRGKKWVPPPRDDREVAAEEQIAIDLGEEYEHALSDATQEEIIDLAAILGFHSMMNQDQYHASLLNKGQPVGMGWDGITKSTQPKLFPMDPPNNTDVEESIKRVKDNDSKLIELNLNNIKNISDEKFEQLFQVLPENENLEVLSLTNVGLTDKTALLLAEAIEKSKTLRVLNVETNFISPPVIVTLVKALLKCRTIEEFRASNQRSSVLGNKIEMEITELVEKNPSLLRLGLHLEFNDARHRVAAHLQRNIDRTEIQSSAAAESSLMRRSPPSESQIAPLPPLSSPSLVLSAHLQTLTNDDASSPSPEKTAAIHAAAMPSIETAFEQKIQLTAANAAEQKSDNSAVQCLADINILKSLKTDNDANAKGDKLDVKIVVADMALPPRMPDAVAVAPATVVAALNIIQNANERKEKEI